MNKRDSIYKEFAIETDDAKKLQLGKLYKEYRNKIVFILRKAKKKYYSDFFKEHNSDIKKTWEGIRNLINVSKKKHLNI